MTVVGSAVTVVGQFSDIPPIRYARNRDIHLAYQQFGSGSVDLVGVPPIAQNIEVAWEHPRFRRLFGGLASFSRYLHFDKRGVGMSDRDAGLPSLDQRVDDLRAIVDHAGVDDAYLCGVSDGGAIAALFAATYPERVRGLVLYGTMAGAHITEAQKVAQPDDLVEAWLEAWGSERTLSPVAFTPSLAGDPDYVRWSARYERQSASPGDIRRLVELSRRIDISEVLPMIRVPTLVLHRGGDQICAAEHAKHVAGRIPNAEFVLLDGDDHAPHAGDIDALIQEVRRFVLGSAAPPAPPDRMLATVLFTDIVGSTALAAAAGDQRWHELLDAHDSIVETLVAAYEGRAVKSTGDGVLAVFDGPGRAVKCAMALRDALAALGLQQRAGIHAGEIERRGDDVAGLAVNITARLLSIAEPNEVLVTRTVRDLVVGSDLRFQTRGRHFLRGIPTPWNLLRAT